MKSRGEIIAVGGDWRDWFHYTFSQLDLTPKKVGLLSTASGDSFFEIKRFNEISEKFSLKPQHLALFQDPAFLDVRGWIKEQDFLIVSGGREEVAKAAWKEEGVEDALRDFWEEGGVILASEEGAGLLFSSAFDRHGNPFRGFTFLEDSLCLNYTHYHTKYQDLIQGNIIAPGYGLNRNTGLHFRGYSFWRALSLREVSEVAFVLPESIKIKETTLIVEG